MSTTPTAAAGPSRPAANPAPSQNQVIEYLVKKGYTRTEAQLRMESQGDDPEGRPLAKKGIEGTQLYMTGFQKARSWVEGTLDIYKPELRRLLWPLFVYTYLQLVRQFYVDGSKSFFETFQADFQNEHKDELRQLQPLNSPEILNESDIAKKFSGNKYRITLSKMGYSLLIRHLEENMTNGGSIVMHIIQQNLNVVQVERAIDDRHSIREMLARASTREDFPQEDEGIPGHNPGSANLEARVNISALQRVKLGPLPLEQDLLDDVMAELADEDQRKPPTDGQSTLIDTFKTMIKVEDNDEAPMRTDIPFPPSRARDVAMEVQKVRENRARFKIEGRTGGAPPPVSVCMFTFHNTSDGVNCIEISDDNQLIGAGMAEHYIRVWRTDGQPLPSTVEDAKPQASRRLVGHHGPIFNVSFSPSIGGGGEKASDSSGRKAPSTAPQYLLSASGDKTVRLWDLSTWTCLVVYEGHMGAVWDVQWGPFGHYFLTGSRDGTARLWSTEYKSELRMFAGHDGDVNYVAFHPNNIYVFTGSYDKTVRMWQVTNGQPVRIFTGHAGDVTAIACAPNGKLLASADDAGAIIIWELAPGKLLKRFRGHDKGGITSLSFSVESNVLISGGLDGTVRVWDIRGSSDPNAQGKVIGDGGAGQKVDLSAQAGAGGKKKGKEAVVSPEQISAFPTKKSPVYKVKFTRMNLATAAGAYLP